MPAERQHRLIRLHRIILSGVALTCLTLTLSVGSRPARADDNQTCSDSNASAAAVIAACSQVILNSRSGGKNIAWAWVNRGRMYNRQGDHDRAIREFDEAIRLDPKYADAYQWRGYAYDDKGEYDTAIADYDEAIRLNPKYAVAYHNRAISYKNKGNNDRAIADYTTAIRYNSKDPLTFNARGLAYQAKGDTAKAIADYDVAIRLNPKYAVAYNNRGLVYYGKSNNDRAISDFNEALRIDPEYAFAYNNRGNAYDSKGDPDRAIVDYNEAIRIDPKYASAYYNRGDTYYNKKADYDRAIADFTEAVRLDPGYTAAYTERGLSYEKKNDNARARDDYNLALATPQKYASGKWAHDKARERLAALPGGPGATPSAGGGGATAAATDISDICANGTAAADSRITACTQAINSGKWSGKNLSWAYDNRGNAYKAKNDRTRAIADYNESLRLDPDNAIAYNNRGIVHQEGGDYDRALADYNDAIRLDRNYATAYTNRGLTYEKKNDVTRARADFNAVLTLPQTYDTDKWALDTAKQRLAALGPQAPVAAAVDIGDACADGNASADARIQNCSQAISSGRWSGKNLSWAYINRGRAYDNKSEYDRAITDYNEAIRLDPASSAAWQGRGYAYDDKGDYDHAIADYNEAIRLDPKYAVAYHNRGISYKNKGDEDHALSDYSEAIRLNPKDPLTFNARGLIYQGKGNRDQAIADYGEAIRLNPKYAVAFNNRGLVYYGKSDYDHAIPDFDDAIRIDPNYAFAYNNRGNAYDGKGDPERAIIDYNEAIRIDPKYASAYYNRGDTYYTKKQDYDRAIADFTEAVRIDAGYTAAYTERGLAYEKKNDIAKARADFTTALATPQKFASGKWAHDTARERLAVIVPNVTPPSVIIPPVVIPPVIVDGGGAGPVVAETSGRRIALVIGNSAYAAMPKLGNPSNDAQDMGTVLKSLGFEVMLGVDLRRAEMEELQIRFAREARRADTALVYYAGHGIQYQGENYLAPVDARIDDETDLRRLLKLQDIIGDIQNASRIRIIIMDACRDNGVMQQVMSHMPATRAAAFTRGFARVNGAEGTVIVYATQADRVAADGVGRNSPFTTALLKHLPTPGVELRTLMTRVRSDVLNSTGGIQRPEVADTLNGEFVFRAAK